eukprot:scaffold111520_cov39-Phaeocystis_antarctica.AAC.1
MATRQRQRQRRSGSGRSLVLGLRLRAGCGLTSAIACSIIPTSSLSQPSSVSFSSSATQREEGGVRSRSYESPRAPAPDPGEHLRRVRVTEVSARKLEEGQAALVCDLDRPGRREDAGQGDQIYLREMDAADRLAALPAPPTSSAAAAQLPPALAL